MADLKEVHGASLIWIAESPSGERFYSNYEKDSEWCAIPCSDEYVECEYEPFALIPLNTRT